MKITKEKVSIKKENVYRLLGKKDNKISRRLVSRTDRLIDKAGLLIKPRVLYTTKEIKNVDKGSLDIGGDVSFRSAKLSRTLGKCDSVTLFIATIGDRIDGLIKETLHNKRMSDAYIYDAIGSVAVEETVENFQKRMDMNVRNEHNTTTLRFSPGYCDWNIGEQKKLFQVLNNGEIDVRLSSNCLMTPRKSVSGVFGIGHSRVIDKKSTNPCKLCKMHSCIARRV